MERINVSKTEAFAEIDKKIETYKKRIDRRKGLCYFDESKTRIKQFENEIAALEGAKEWINKIN